MCKKLFLKTTCKNSDVFEELDRKDGIVDSAQPGKVPAKI